MARFGAVWLLVSMCLLAGCGGPGGGREGVGAPVAEQRAGRIAANECSINIGSDPSSLDPGQITDIPAAKSVLCLIRGLTTLDGDCQPRPELAESWTISEDGRVYTFQLREATWTNEQPVTADDFVYAWKERVLQPAYASQYAYQMFYVKGARAYYEDTSRGIGSIGVHAIAPDKLQVELESPTPFFLELIAHHTYFPVCAEVDRENPGWHQTPETYVGCGPYVLESYHPGYELTARKNPDYWNAGGVKMERVTLRMIEQESTERIAYDNGEIDGTNTVPTQDMEELKVRADFRQESELASYYLHFQCQRPPLDDARVRRALTLAVDRRSIVENITRAGQRPALYLSPPELYAGGAPETALRDAAFDEARRLLAEAGYPGGKGFRPLVYLYNTMEGHKLIALAIQETWRRELGIEVTLENQEFKVMLDRRRAGDYDVARSGWVADFADPINFLELFDSASDNNDSRWYDDHFDALLAAARAEADPAKRMDILREADTYTTEQLPMLPVYFYTRSYLVAPGLNYRLNAMSLFDPATLSWSAADAAP